MTPTKRLEEYEKTQELNLKEMGFVANIDKESNKEFKQEKSYDETEEINIDSIKKKHPIPKSDVIDLGDDDITEADIFDEEEDFKRFKKKGFLDRLVHYLKERR